MKTLALIFLSLFLFCFSDFSSASADRTPAKSAKKSHHHLHRHHAHRSGHAKHLSAQHKAHHRKGSHSHFSPRKEVVGRKVGSPGRYLAQELPAKVEIDHSKEFTDISGSDPYDLKNSHHAARESEDAEYYNVKPSARDRKLNPVSRKHLPYERVQYGYSTSTPDIHRSASLDED